MILRSILDVIEKLPKNERVDATVHYEDGSVKDRQIMNVDGVRLKVLCKRCRKSGREYILNFKDINKIVINNQ